MNSALDTLRQTGIVTWFLVKAAALNLYGHWALALFSIFGAFVIWVVIQDVENPRVQGVVPGLDEQAIAVEFVNGSPDFVPVDAAFVRVRVEAREGTLEELRQGDFRATVDLQGLEAGERVSLPVEVTPDDDNVRVIEVIEPRVEVELAPVVREEFPVRVRYTSPIAEGFELQNVEISPAFVEVSGREELVANVDRVEADVNISGRRADFEVTVDLVARNANGQRQVVTITPPQAVIRFDIQQTVTQQEFPVLPVTTGSPAAGYLVTAIQVEPPTVRVTAPEDVLDGISEIVLDPIDLGGATTNVTRTRAVDPPPNTSVSPAEVSVTVVIEPIVCLEEESQPCGGATFLVSIRFRDQPPNLTLATGQYVVPVQVTGPLPMIRDLSLSDIDASVSLAGATAGARLYTPEVSVPEGLSAEAMQDITVTLEASP